MEAALKGLPRQNLPQVLVGYENSDDAGVYLITPDLALVQTVDFFSPVVDDPFTYGAIAAANALSDVYAMGGQPRSALSIAAFPTQGIEHSVLGDIMRGGLAKLHEAGVALVGGHSVRDDEIKFGYAVTGTVELKNIKKNSNARPDSRLVLTKPLGAGLVTTAIKRGTARPEDVATAVHYMTQLNKRASEIAVSFNVDTMTDITGFGLVGHACEVAKASAVSLRIDHSRLPVLPGALQYSEAGCVAGGLKSNREFYSPRVHISDRVPKEFLDLVFDPQTSGGLLIFVAVEQSAALLQTLAAEGITAAEIGATLPTSDITDNYLIHIV